MGSLDHTTELRVVPSEWVVSLGAFAASGWQHVKAIRFRDDTARWNPKAKVRDVGDDIASTRDECATRDCSGIPFLRALCELCGEIPNLQSETLALAPSVEPLCGKA